MKSIEEIAAEIAVKVPPEEWDKMLPDASDFIDVGDCHKEIARLRAEVERLQAAIQKTEAELEQAWRGSPLRTGIICALDLLRDNLKEHGGEEESP